MALQVHNHAINIIIIWDMCYYTVVRVINVPPYCYLKQYIVFFKMGQPRPLFGLFSSFGTENLLSSQQDLNLDRRS